MSSTSGKFSDTSMSEEAFELINCFYDGVDVLVRALAEEIAAEDGQEKDGVLLIERRHVQEAGQRVIDSLRGLFNDKCIPQDVINRMHGMESCFTSK